MTLEFKNKEDFQQEIEFIAKINDCSLIEAILDYQAKYDLDSDYISMHLITEGVYEKLTDQAEKLNLIRKVKKPLSLNGV